MFGIDQVALSHHGVALARGHGGAAGRASHPHNLHGFAVVGESASVLAPVVLHELADGLHRRGRH